ncbi:recombinase family protein [Glutamicibacter sp.]|uniref:recombinase family protein n=1 Tax=Glutamicibacter sp. TaxID=1931995 RepID=UPI0028BF3AF5|nr:recombinase family protein [Glutamicibacter sp.]
MNAQDRPRAVLYLRQSIAREESISMELQEEAGRRYAEQQGYEVIAVEADEGISGRSWKTRPAVQRVMTMIENREADVIVLWKWSRLSRARLDWAIAIDKVESAGGRIESATEQVDVSTSTGRFARGMLAEFAAFESERISDTWKEAQARRLANGLPVNGLPRFGYQYDPATGYTPHPNDGPVLRECYLRYLRGASFRQLTVYLRGAAEVPHRHRSSTGIWRVNSVIHILDNPFAAGLIRHKDELYQGAHEPLISAEEWAEYQALRKQRTSTRTRQSSKNQSPFSVLSICVVCQNRYYVSGRTSNGTIMLKCSGVNSLGAHRGANIIEHKIEASFLKWLTEYIPRINQLAADYKADETPATDTEAKIRRALTKAQARLDSLTAKYVDDVIPKESYVRLRDEQTEIIDSLNRQLVEASRPKRKPPELDPKLLEDWPEMPVEVKKQLVHDLVLRIEISEGYARDVKGVHRKIDVVPKWAVDH